MSGTKFRGTVHLLATSAMFLSCITVTGLVMASSWPFGTANAAMLTGTFMTMGLLFCWRAVANLKASEDLYLLSLVRKMGGRITAPQLAETARRNIQRVTRFLEVKVQRGQAVMSRDDDEVTYIFDGFVDQSGKDFAFKL